MKIYHILPKHDWEQVKDRKFYAPSSLKKDGFIHCSTKDQVIPTLNRRFKGNKDLLLLIIDPEKVKAEIIYEDLKGSVKNTLIFTAD